MESRGQGFQFNYFYIYEFMGEAQDAAAAKEEGGKRSLWKRAAAGLDELELEPWSNHSGEESTYSPTRLDGKEQDAAAAPPGRRGTRGTGRSD